MKNILSILIISITLLSCEEKKEAKRIPLTSSSKEAVENFNQGEFRQEQLEDNEANAHYKKAFELDSNFALAKINFNNEEDPSDNKRRLAEAYNSRASLSEIESVIVSIKYETTINDDYAKSDLMMDSLIKKYPDLSPKFIFLYPAYNLRNNEISLDNCLLRLQDLI